MSWGDFIINKGIGTSPTTGEALITNISSDGIGTSPYIDPDGIGTSPYMGLDGIGTSPSSLPGWKGIDVTLDAIALSSFANPFS